MEMTQGWDSSVQYPHHHHRNLGQGQSFLPDGIPHAWEPTIRERRWLSGSAACAFAPESERWSSLSSTWTEDRGLHDRTGDGSKSAKCGASMHQAGRKKQPGHHCWQQNRTGC